MKYGSKPIMTEFAMIIYWSQAGLLCCVGSGVSGCMADGTSYRDAAANAEPAVEARIDTAKKLGRAIPEPRGSFAMLELPLVAAN